MRNATLPGTTTTVKARQTAVKARLAAMALESVLITRDRVEAAVIARACAGSHAHALQLLTAWER